jgi:predicted transcriptional regulator
MRMVGARLTRFELEIMERVWSLGRASVREVWEQLPARKRPAYTTVQTIMRRLEDKGALRQARKIGNAIVYQPVLERHAAYGSLIDSFLALFGGSLRPVVAHLAETGRLELEDLRELESLARETRKAAKP